MNLQAFWAAEAASLRDTSALLNKEALSYDPNFFGANRLKPSQNIEQTCDATWKITEVSEVISLELGIYATNYLKPAWKTLQQKEKFISQKITQMKAAGWRQRSVEEPVIDKLVSEVWQDLLIRLQSGTFNCEDYDVPSHLSTAWIKDHILEINKLTSDSIKDVKDEFLINLKSVLNILLKTGSFMK